MIDGHNIFFLSCFAVLRGGTGYSFVFQGFASANMRIRELALFCKEYLYSEQHYGYK